MEDRALNPRQPWAMGRRGPVPRRSRKEQARLLDGLASRRMRLLEILQWKACHGRSATASLDLYREADGIHDWQLAG
ncbi:hypothetical protein Pla86_13080 [Planctomycetes bacterium Pla86]|uniref:Uncharacterized protein n=1 Tax=Engelhardtia mirabilis TaxID=2528011 RepID=A0A518BGZ1_9BACT|nr:hypothetical protein Pla133_13080 [Planctomycetes bacterium Pla133]QDV00569.1 hypothetical protein Pla86_13080 [Planctomycetes bacterium Pla86]